MNVANALSRNRRLGSVERAHLKAAEEQVARALGLRADFVGRLNEDEQHRLRDLVRAATPEDQVGYGGLCVAQLGKGDRRELERLIERGAGLDPGTLEKEREEAKMSARVAAIARKALMPAPRPCFEEEGSVRIPQVVFRHLDRKAPALHIAELGLLVFFWTQLQNARCLCPGGRVERDEDGEPVLVIDARLGLGTRFGADEVSGWERHLAHLAQNDWIVVEGGGSELRVKRGPRALAADRLPKHNRNGGRQ